jgi:hypothetical protein
MKKTFFIMPITLALFVTALFATLLVMGCPGPEPEPDPGVTYTVIFDKNGGDTDPVPATKKVAPKGTVKFPETPPTRQGYYFMGYTRDADGEIAFTENGSQIMADNTKLYAQWDDGKAKLVVDDYGRTTIVQKMPAFTATGGATRNEDGTYKLATTGSGAVRGDLDYLFPADVGTTHEDANTYDYFILSTQILSGESGNTTGIQLKTKGTEAGYGGGGSNKMPWLSNPDGKTIILEVSGAGTTKGLRIYVPPANAQGVGGVKVDKLKITSITFYKLPRYTVTFNYNDSGTTPDKEVADVKGKDDNMDSPGVTSAKWPANPANSVGHFFLGWFDENDILYTATTPIVKNITLTAKWATEEPTGWMEQITTTATAVPVYGFDIPSGGKLGDYTKVVVKFKAGSADGATGRFRAWGPYAATVFASGGLGSAVTTLNPDMKNANDGLLITTTGTYTGSFNIESTWDEYTLDISTAVMHPTYNSGTDGSGQTLFTEATGIQLLGIGIVAAGGANDSRTYYLKDLRLENDDGTKTLDVIDPKDSSLFSGEGGKNIYVKQGDGKVTRSRMYAD